MPTHAQTIDQLVATMVHLAKAKVAMDGAPEGLFGESYAEAVSTTRGTINDSLNASAAGVLAVLSNEQREREVGVQASLLGGPTADELLQHREKRKKKGEKKAGETALRPTYQAFRHVETSEIYVVRFYPGTERPEPTGIHGPYAEDNDRSIDKQAQDLPKLSFDANPDLIDWFSGGTEEFEVVQGLACPVVEPKGSEPAPATQPEAVTADA